LFIIQNDADELPMLIFGHQTLNLVAAHLFIQSIKQLLARRRSRISGSMVTRTAKSAEIKQPLRRPVKHDTHTVHEMDNPRGRFTHVFDWGLVGQKIPTIYRIIKVLPRRVSFSFRVNRSVDTALCTYGVRTF